MVWGFHRVMHMEFLAQSLAHNKCSMVAIIKGIIVNHCPISDNHKISVTYKKKHLFIDRWSLPPCLEVFDSQ